MKCRRIKFTLQKVLKNLTKFNNTMMKVLTSGKPYRIIDLFTDERYYRNGNG